MVSTLIPPGQLHRISDLQLLARTVVEGLMSGIHGSPHTGGSIDFAQYRPYAQGDDLRFLDWKLFGRTDRLHLKQFQQETSLRCTLLLDCSASMSYASGEVDKFAYARMLSACLALILKGQGDAVGLIAYHGELITHLAPRGDARHFAKLLVTLNNLIPERATDTPSALRFLGDVLKPRGMVILISDLLHPLDEVLAHLKSLRARRHDVLVLQISDPAEQSFPFEKSITLIDVESGGEQFVVPESVRTGYLANRARHFERIREEALAAEIDIAEFTTDQPLDHALRHFLHHRTRALRTSGARNRVGHA